MKQIHLLAITGVLILVVFSGAPAQTVRGSIGFFQLGYLHAPKAGVVAQAFVPDWFPRFNDHFIYSGAEGWLRRNRLLVPENPTDFNAAKGLWLGLGIGYLMSVKSAHWQQIPNSLPTRFKPEYALNGFYVMLSIGGGGFQYVQ